MTDVQSHSLPSREAVLMISLASAGLWYSIVELMIYLA